MDEHLCPEIRLAAFNQVTGLLFEHGVVICDGNKLVITESFGVGNVRQVRILCLAELPNYQWLVELEKTSALGESLLTKPTHMVLLEERLRVVVAVNVNLCDSIENSQILATRLHTGLKPGQY
jgi:hypothetical protein